MKQFIAFYAVLVASVCSSGQEPLVVIDGADSPESRPIATEHDMTANQELMGGFANTG
jgi:hypothetical protein